MDGSQSNPFLLPGGGGGWGKLGAANWRPKGLSPPAVRCAPRLPHPTRPVPLQPEPRPRGPRRPSASSRLSSWKPPGPAGRAAAESCGQEAPRCPAQAEARPGLTGSGSEEEGRRGRAGRARGSCARLGSPRARATRGTEHRAPAGHGRGRR